MYPDGLVFGLVNTADRIEDRRLADKLRSFTISWSRYGYHGRIIEGDRINGILNEALELGYRWCLIQAYGQIIGEHWYPEHWNRVPFEVAITQWLEQTDFFVAGSVLGSVAEGFGLHDRFLLVDLHRYRELGRPVYDRVASYPVECVKPVARRWGQERSDARGNDPELYLLAPSEEREGRRPTARGWSFIDASLRHGLPVYPLDPQIAGHTLDLDPGTPDQRDRFAAFLDHGITEYRQCREDASVGRPQRQFLDLIERQVTNARRGVFLWNLESYDDVQTPPAGFRAPVSTLYSVASGFKPNMLLRRFGFDGNTRVVFFDYSPNALEVKQRIQQEWDGEDYPRFVRYLFRRHPDPETYYHLWADLTPDTVAWNDMYRFWQAEIEKWGGEQAIRQHWQQYRELRHEYVLCNLLADPTPLLQQIDRDPQAVIWWSNAFFTVYSNWFYTVDERKTRYESWICALAARNPEMFLYGADFQNISVNYIQAGSYHEQLTAHGNQYLNPVKLYQCEIRF